MIRFFKRIKIKIIPAESKVELFLRTIYHRIGATRLNINWQLWRSRHSYIKWKALQNKLSLSGKDSFPLQPKVTFLLEVFSENLNDALNTLRSIQGQHISNWEIIVIRSSDSPDLLDFPETILRDPRFKQIPKNQRDKLNNYKESTGEFILHCLAGDIFARDLLYFFYQKFNQLPLADVYYYDCEYKLDPSKKLFPFFKPAGFSPELLLSVNYLSRSFIRNNRIYQLFGSVDRNLSLLNQELNLLLLLSEDEDHFQHIPQVLLTQQKLYEESDEQAEKVICSHLSRSHLNGVSCQEQPLLRRYRWDVNDPSVSIIIPSKNNYQLLKELIDSIFVITDYSNYSITIVDNGSDDPQTQTYYKELDKEPRVRIVHYDKPFNYSEAINIGVANSESEILLLLNNDMKVIDSGWMREMVQWVARPEIGVVGAKLIRKNHSIQHAGIILGMNGFLGHLYLNAPENYTGLLGSINWYRNVNAVTGACQMMRRDLFNEVGGYDITYKLVFGDVDFCLKIIKLGFRNLYNPFAVLYHYEGSSRGYRSPVIDILTGFEKMSNWIKVDDPYFSPNITYTTIPMCNLSSGTIDRRLEFIKMRRESMEKNI